MCTPLLWQPGLLLNCYYRHFSLFPLLGNVLLKLAIVGLVSIARSPDERPEEREPGEDCRVPRVTLWIHSELIITDYRGILFINIPPEVRCTNRLEAVQYST